MEGDSNKNTTSGVCHKNIKIVVDVGLGWSYNAALADLAGICFGLFLVIRGWIFVGLVLSGR
ncbi:MAG: hypothetical protein K9G33_12805, partial [Sneathiella sp.]|nr:hypothetical protein [Sneathiella sp.]